MRACVCIYDSLRLYRIKKILEFSQIFILFSRIYCRSTRKLHKNSRENVSCLPTHSDIHGRMSVFFFFKSHDTTAAQREHSSTTRRVPRGDVLCV